MQKNLTLISTLVILLSSCGILSPVVTPQVKEYQITTTNADEISCNAESNAAILQVSPVRVFTPFDSRGMYYSVAEYRLSSYSLNQWASTPSEMFNQAILQKLQKACIYRDVSSSEFMVTAKYRLASQVMDFKQVIINGSSNMNLKVYAQLIDNTNNTVIKNKTFIETASVESSPEGYIKGANEVTNSFTNDLVTWLSTK